MIHARLNFACESSTFCRKYFIRMTSSYRKLIWWRLFDCFRYGGQPTTRETHVFQLRRTRRKDRSVWILPTFAAMPQVQTIHARTMLCEINKAKYLRRETRSICINRLTVSPIMHEQTNSFLCTTNFCLCRAELRREEVALSKNWNWGRLWRGHTKNENSSLFRAILTFGRSSIATRRQFEKQSRTRSNNTGTYDSFL